MRRINYSPQEALYCQLFIYISTLIRSVQVLKREWGAESNGKLPHLSWVSEFAVEDLLLRRTSALVPEFVVKDQPLGRTH